MEKKNSNIGTIVAISLAGIALWQLGLKYLYAYRRFQYKVDRIRIVPSGNGMGSVQIYLLVANPTNVQLFINSLSADIYFNDTLIGTVDNQINRYLYSNSITQLALNFTVDTTELFNKILKDIKNTTIHEWRVGIVGTLRAEKQDIPLDMVLTTQTVEEMVK